MMKQKRLLEQFIKTYRRDRLAHAYVFHGPTGSGKKQLVHELAKVLFCQKLNEEPCQLCSHCRRIDAGEFPDVHYVEAENQTIKIEQVRQLQNDVVFSSMENDKKVYIVDGVEKLSVSAANSLLKFLEEPQQQVYFFLLTTHIYRVLPTILSRAQIVTVQATRQDDMQEQYKENGLTTQQAYVMSRMFPDVQLGLTMHEQEEFQLFYQSVLSWALKLVEGDRTSYIDVQTKLSRYITNKDWANIGLDIVSVVVRDAEWVRMTDQSTPLYNTPVQRLAITFEQLAKVKKMLFSNVSSQVCYEWLAIQVGR